MYVTLPNKIFFSPGATISWMHRWQMCYSWGLQFCCLHQLILLTSAKREFMFQITFLRIPMIVVTFLKSQCPIWNSTAKQHFMPSHFIIIYHRNQNNNLVLCQINLHVFTALNFFPLFILPFSLLFVYQWHHWC